MTAKQLIKILKKVDGNDTVFINNDDFYYNIGKTVKINNEKGKIIIYTKERGNEIH